MAKIFTVAYVPDDLAPDWLQHLRNFDMAHVDKGCHFEVMTDAPEMTLPQIIETMRINPGLTFSDVFERKKP